MVLTVRWLGQAGFELRTDDGATCLIDPYLSDWCTREALVERRAPVPVDVRELIPTVVVTSHWHEDHLDPDTTRLLATFERRDRMGRTTCKRRSLCAIRGGRGPNCHARTRGVRCRGAIHDPRGFARHDVPGWICEDAISILVEASGTRVFHTGDTEYDTRIIDSIAPCGPVDVGLFAINGTGGNMNASEAALLAYRIAPRIAIPMHYGMWVPRDYGPGATIDPAEFDRVYRRLTDKAARILGHGETFEISKPARGSERGVDLNAGLRWRSRR